MKKIIPLVLSLVIIPGIIMAQQNKRSEKKDSSQNKSSFMSRSNVILISKMNQRKTYNWATGQRATPSGRQAGDRYAIWARVLGDSAIVVKNPYAKKD